MFFRNRPPVVQAIAVFAFFVPGAMLLYFILFREWMGWLPPLGGALVVSLYIYFRAKREQAHASS